MAGLKNHPGLWLRDDAAAAFDAYEDKYGRRTVNSAGRTEAEQNDLIRRWKQGGTYNRPPYLYQPASPASASNHVKGGGLAVDIGDYQTFQRNSEEFGFFWFGASDPVHFEFRGWNGGGGSSSFNQNVANEQAWLNASRGEHLAVGGLKGAATTEAYKRYQTFLRAYGYQGAIDGIWGAGTQEAHAKYWAEWNAPKPGVPAASGVPSGLQWDGIQQMLKALYGYSGAIDGIAGVGTVSAFQRFLNASGFNAGGVDGQWGPNTAKAAQRWLKARWGYGAGIDGDFGAGTRAAWQRADAANGAAF